MSGGKWLTVRVDAARRFSNGLSAASFLLALARIRQTL